MAVQNFTFEEIGGIDGLKLISPFVYGDFRGEFRKLYEHNLFAQQRIHIDFSELDESLSSKGVLRGMHMQHTKPQCKLVRVISGEVYDVAVDIRRDSPTFGKYAGVTLSAENRRLFFIPEGFLHGFLTLRDNTVFSYLCGNDYLPACDGGVRWNDPALQIAWPTDLVDSVILSPKDQALPSLADFLSSNTW